MLRLQSPTPVFKRRIRIGAIGLLVDRFGIDQAEGFLHVFEGWAVFLACIAILFLMAKLMQRLSGVATLTRQFVEAVKGTGAKILDTRKTTPGWRRIQHRDEHQPQRIQRRDGNTGVSHDADGGRHEAGLVIDHEKCCGQASDALSGILGKTSLEKRTN